MRCAAQCHPSPVRIPIREDIRGKGGGGGRVQRSHWRFGLFASVFQNKRGDTVGAKSSLENLPHSNRF